MTPLKSQTYPKMAKAILAAFILAAALGPSITRSADRKTRSHITAISGRVLPKSEAEKKAISSVEEAERENAIKTQDLAEAQRLAEDRRIELLAEKFLAEQKEEQIRLEKKLRIAEEKLEKQRVEEELKAQKELARQLAEEERATRKRIEERLARELEESERQLKERLLAEEQAMALELQKKVEEERRLALETLQNRLERVEEAEMENLQENLSEREDAAKEKLLAKLAEEELVAKKKIEKEISEKTREARKAIDNRLDERARIAKAEMESRVEQESLMALKELKEKVRSEEIARESALRVKLEQEEKDALAEINKRLEEERIQLSERKRVDEERKAREIAERGMKQGSRELVVSGSKKAPRVADLGNSFVEDEYKRPSLWGSFKRVPKQLMASMGNISVSSKDSYPGYLAFRAPPPLRFSDDISLAKRPPAPALPEFSVLAPGRGSLTVETRLSEEEARKQQLMNQVVFELEPHTILSGNIDTKIPREVEEHDRFLIEESEESVVRPEEVLIFFENKRDGDSTRTIIPFSPARPSQNAPAKSGATYNRN